MCQNNNRTPGHPCITQQYSARWDGHPWVPNAWAVPISLRANQAFTQAYEVVLGAGVAAQLGYQLNQ